MPKLPIKIKPGALPTTTDKVTQGVLDKLPEVDRRELMRGALGALGDLSLAGKAVDVVAPLVKKAIPKIDIKSFFDIPIIRDFQLKTYKDMLKDEVIIPDRSHPSLSDEVLGPPGTDNYSWEYFKNRYSLEELEEMGITSENSFEKLINDDEFIKDMFHHDIEFLDQSEGFITQELESFLDGTKKLGDLDKEVQEGLKYLISDKKMTLPEIRKLILDPD